MAWLRSTAGAFWLHHSAHSACLSLAATRRLHLYECQTDHAAAAVSKLAALSQLTSISLGVHGCAGSELDRSYPDLSGFDWGDLVHLPPLGALTALTELYIAGMTPLPPDFGQLRHLRRLSMFDVYSNIVDDGGALLWGIGILAGLASLTRIEALHWMPRENWASNGEPPKVYSKGTCCGTHPCRSRAAGHSAPPRRDARPPLLSKLARAAGGPAPRSNYHTLRRSRRSGISAAAGSPHCRHPRHKSRAQLLPGWRPAQRCRCPQACTALRLNCVRLFCTARSAQHALVCTASHGSV